MSLKDIAAQRRNIFYLDPTAVQIEPGWNSRDFEDPANVEHVESLAASIEAVGVLEPLTVVMKGDVPFLTNGESRLRAVRLLLERGVEIKTVPVLPEPRHANEADHLASQMVRNSGRPFTPMEMATLFVKLIGYGWSEADIAKRGGLSVERVRQIVLLNKAPADVRASIQRGEIAPTTVQRILAGGITEAEVSETVRTAVETAKAEGKAKAGPRHVAAAKGEKKPSKKKPAAEPRPTAEKRPAEPKVGDNTPAAVLAELLAAVSEIDVEDGEKTLVQIAIDPARWAAIQDIYGGF